MRKVWDFVWSILLSFILSQILSSLIFVTMPIILSCGCTVWSAGSSLFEMSATQDLSYLNIWNERHTAANSSPSDVDTTAVPLLHSENNIKSRLQFVFIIGIQLFIGVIRLWILIGNLPTIIYSIRLHNRITFPTLFEHFLWIGVLKLRLEYTSWTLIWRRRLNS